MIRSQLQSLRSPRRLRVLAPALVAAVLPAAVLGAQAPASQASTGGPGGITDTASGQPYCGIEWGSLAKAADRSTTPRLRDVRAGRHACFDRLVLDVRGRRAGYAVRYVRAVHADGSGRTVPLRGGADLAVVAEAPAYDRAGRGTYRFTDRRHLVDVSGYRTFRQVAWAGSFEGRTTIGLGVRARLPFRVFTLAGPDGGSRLVVDVAHRW